MNGPYWISQRVCLSKRVYSDGCVWSEDTGFKIHHCGTGSSTFNGQFYVYLLSLPVWNVVIDVIVELSLPE